MIERCGHRLVPSIFLIKGFISFRLIEHEFGAIVNNVEGSCGISRVETTETQAVNDWK
jgi:hypothetical protein